MKKLIASAGIFLTLFNVTAAEKGNWGVRAAFDLDIPGKFNAGDTHIDMYKPGYGFSIGGVYYQPIASGFYFEPGLNFFYDTYSFKDLLIMGSSYPISTEDVSVRKAGFRLPLHFGYDISFNDTWRLAIYTGAELSYTISKGAHAKHPENFGDDYDSDIFGINDHRNFDCAWKVGVAIPVSYVWVGIDAAIGLTDLMPGNISFHENRVSVTATYYF